MIDQSENKWVIVDMNYKLKYSAMKEKDQNKVFKMVPELNHHLYLFIFAVDFFFFEIDYSTRL
jgi:formylmethanofuran dehydrogenase subunit B